MLMWIKDSIVREKLLVKGQEAKRLDVLLDRGASSSLIRSNTTRKVFMLKSS